jgi:putative transposase
MDNGPEFAGQAVDLWAYQQGVKLHFSEPGKPVPNVFIESFNGKIRDECLNEHGFLSLGEARETMAACRRDYNQVRPHSALGYQTPEEFAAHKGVDFCPGTHIMIGPKKGARSRTHNEGNECGITSVTYEPECFAW